MSFSGIALYSLRAGTFAAAACGLYVLLCRLRGRRVTGKRALGVFYLAALVQITVLRGGVDFGAVLAGGRDAPQLIPLATLARLVREGSLWNLVYNVVGNLIWFVPLGCLLGRRRWFSALGAGALLSAGIEICQYLLRTGATDVDDVILNALGALLGWILIARKERLHG